MTEILVRLALLHYGMAFLAYLATALTRSRWVGRAARALLLVGMGFNVAALIVRWVETGHAPFSNLFESLVFFACALALVNVVFELLYRARLLGGIALAVILAMLSYSAFWADPAARQLMPALQSRWLEVHVSSYFFGYAALAIAFAAAMIDLLQALFRKRPQEPLSAGRDGELVPNYSAVAHRAVALGFPFLTVGLVTGCIWAKRAWGDYWTWDPKETWSLITWIVYLIYLHLPWLLPKLFPSLKQREAKARLVQTIALFVGFAVVLFTYLGLNYLPSAADSLHLYGSPSPE